MNVGIDALLGHLPDWENTGDVLRYVGGTALDGLSAGQSGNLVKGMSKLIGNAGWLEFSRMAPGGITKAAPSTQGLLTSVAPQFTVEAVQIPGRQLVQSGLGKSFGFIDDAAKGGGRVFWSGGDDAMNAATNYAKANGMTTLEMTRAGQNLTKLTKGMPWEKAEPMWQRLSAAYAKGATGPVHVFQNASTGVRLNSVWRTVEYPILNGKNKFIFHNIFRPW
jgi:hypothetical protein